MCDPFVFIVLAYIPQLILVYINYHIYIFFLFLVTPCISGDVNFTELHN